MEEALNGLPQKERKDKDMGEALKDRLRKKEKRDGRSIKSPPPFTKKERKKKEMEEASKDRLTKKERKKERNLSCLRARPVDFSLC